MSSARSPNITTSNTEYLGGFQYNNGVLQYIPTAEGYVKNTVVNGVNTYDYIFNYTDHLGNIRLSYGIAPVTQLLTIFEENNYYPFGMKHATYNYQLKTIENLKDVPSLNTTSDSKAAVPIDPDPIGNINLQIIKNSGYQYKFNGKELQDELGLNVYDYGARMYDPAGGPQFWQVDPLAEKFPNRSPYEYCFSNPINLIDPTGMGPDDWVEKKDGSIYWDDKAISQSTTKAGETYRGTDYTRYKVWDNDKAKGLVQEHYASDKGLHYEQHNGKYQLDFSGSVVTDNQITGKELNNAKNADFGIEGKMSLNAVFSNGGTYTASTYDFTSGPYGNGPSPNKNYTAYKYADSNESGMQIYGSPGFKLYLEDFNGRDGLRIHPDTNSRGTMGCIGINGSANQLKSLGNFFKEYFKAFYTMNVNFQIPNNPNYGNNGKANPHLGQ